MTVFTVASLSDRIRSPRYSTFSLLNPDILRQQVLDKSARNKPVNRARCGLVALLPVGSKYTVGHGFEIEVPANNILNLPFSRILA